MNDQWVKVWSAFRREDRGDGAVAGRIAAEPIDGLGRKGNEPAGLKQLRGAGDRPRCGRLDQGG
jgi:hypothetical protein